jgi:pilus assembly protein CpaC
MRSRRVGRQPGEAIWFLGRSASKAELGSIISIISDVVARLRRSGLAGATDAPSVATPRPATSQVTSGGPRIRALILGLLGLLVVAQGGAAEIDLRGDGQPFRRLVVAVNKSLTIRTHRPFARTVVAAPEFVDVLPMSNQTLYIQAKKVGTTNLSIFDENARMIEVIDLEVTVDAADIQRKIVVTTGSAGIRVSSRGSQLMLTGMAADTVAADRAIAVAKGLAPEALVVNAMEVAPPQQVMLEVRFLEVVRDAGRQLGVNFFGATPGGRGFNTGLPGNQPPVTNIPPGSPPAATTTCSTANCVVTQPPGITPVPVFTTVGTLLGGAAGAVSPFATILANIISNGRGTSLDVMVTALEEKGLLRRLAEPNLIALSGDTARFLAGGEFPVPIASTTQGGVPTITIEFKKFGVELAFVPTVLRRGVINLRVEPSVSELDFTNAVTISGTTIPALTRRDARTTVELRDGQSFAIAGLLQTRSARDLQQVPWLGSVPVIGALFRSSAFLQSQTDLVIIVTPRMVAPAVPGQQLASPLDDRLPSNDVDFFLNGQPEVRKRYSDFVTSGGNLKGPYGHIIVPEFGVGGVAAVVSAKN